VTKHGRNYLLRAKISRFLKNAPVGDVRRDQTWPKLLVAGKIWHFLKKIHLLGTVSVIEPLQKTHRLKKKDNKFVLYRENKKNTA
jgi:hypothetical protein